MTTDSSSEPLIDIDRLKRDILELAKIGQDPATRGVTRLGFSDADMQARSWLMTRIADAGGSAGLDGAGNVVGRFAGAADLPPVLVGSHIDSVPAGGMFDGTLGVLAGVEAMRTLGDLNRTLHRPVEVIAFADEEGRFGGMFGAQAVCGQLTADWIHNAHDVDGIRLADAMQAQGLDPMAALDAARRPDDIHAYLELHIEQGPVLEQERKNIGLVDGIAGVFKWIVRLVGKAAHAGTSPMHMRSDAFMGLADFAHEISRIIEEDGSAHSRLTVGKVELLPGNPHTIPGEVIFSLVGRDMSPQVMSDLADSCRKVLSAIARRHHLKFEFEQLSWLEPQGCDAGLLQVFEDHADRLGLSHLHMPSGAGHDTQFMACLTRAALIFVPSVGGTSHAPDEWTHWVDAENGANVLLRTLAAVADEGTPKTA
ncbi:MAG: Zn-dependent hydrolase [Deltaproteobacteria bacterium]|nr:Zn-dependent hydrolase [Deltaproteobacteria bacterium]